MILFLIFYVSYTYGWDCILFWHHFFKKFSFDLKQISFNYIFPAPWSISWWQPLTCYSTLMSYLVLVLNQIISRYVNLLENISLHFFWLNGFKPFPSVRILVYCIRNEFITSSFFLAIEMPAFRSKPLLHDEFTSN